MNAQTDIADFIPQSLEAEQALLGAILMRNDTYLDVAEIVEPDHFYEQVNGTLYSLLGERIGRGESVTPVTLSAALGKDSKFEIGSGVTVSKYLARLVSEGVTTIMHAPDYARTIRDLWARRRVIAMARDLMSRALGGASDEGIEALLDEADGELAAIRFGKTIEGVMTLDEAMTASIDMTARAYERGATVGLSSGIDAVDAMTGPLMAGDLVTLLGASGHGKSALVAQILKRNAEPSLDAHQGNCAGLFFSMEMDSAQNARRILAAETGITSQKQKAADILPAEFEFLTDAARKLSKLPIIFDETPGQTVTKLVRKSRALKRRYKNLGLIVVDHLLEIAPENPRWTKIETVENAVQVLKRLAKELQVVIILLAQATREGQKREHWRLRTTDIWGGDRIKQSSDIVLSLGIPTVWLGEREPEKSRGDDMNPNSAWHKWVSQCNDWQGKAEIGAPKVRDGQSGNWRTIAFDGPRTLFSDL